MMIRRFSSLFALGLVALTSCAGREPAIEGGRPVGLRVVGAIGQSGDGPGGLKRPQGVTVDFEGNIYVADTGNHRVQKFTPDGRAVAEAGGFGRTDGKFRRPVDICVDFGLNIYVLDLENQRIQIFDRHLNWVGVEEGDLGRPRALDVSDAREVFLVDEESDGLLRIRESRDVEEFGDMRAGPGRLTHPTALRVGYGRQIYVADAGRIAVFDFAGNYVREIGRGTLRRPQGVAVDDQGRLYVSDGECVFGFDPRGEESFVHRGHLVTPEKIAIGHDGLLYVADSGQDNVMIFEVLIP